MRLDAQRLLSVLRLPARLTLEEAGYLLGFHPEGISFLCLPPRYWSLWGTRRKVLPCVCGQIMQLRKDQKWLSKRPGRAPPLKEKNEKAKAKRGESNRWWTPATGRFRWDACHPLAPCYAPLPRIPRDGRAGDDAGTETGRPSGDSRAAPRGSLVLLLPVLRPVRAMIPTGAGTPAATPTCFRKSPHGTPSTET